jgi:hypothetical protein
MKKLAANYLISESNKFLKNGILLADDNGTAIEYIDTNGDLDEIAQLTFHNGILVAGQIFIRVNLDVKPPFNKNIQDKEQLSLSDLIELAKKYQLQYPDKTIPEIWSALHADLALSHRKENTTGIFLLIGCDLPALRFTAKSRLKKLL